MAILLVAVASWRVGADASPPALDPSAAYCLTAPREAHADAGTPADVVARVDVPMQTPAPGATASSRAARQGDVVRVTVQAPRAGSLVVHGLTDARPIGRGEAVTVAFRAIYAGRFPLHFHGADGSHFEILALEVRPGA